MQSQWSEEGAAAFVEEHASRSGDVLALRMYSARLLGQDADLVLHGGGNTSVKTSFTNILGEVLPGIFVKASGHDMGLIGPEGFSGLDLERLRKLRGLDRLPDAVMLSEVRACLLHHDAATPSIETLVHAFIPKKFIDHTHADAVLALTNQRNGSRLIDEALGDAVITIDYVTPGFELAKAAADAYESDPGRQGMVWIKHGIVTWGETARESYEAMIELVSKAEAYLARGARRSATVAVSTSVPVAQERWLRVAPVLRGLLAQPSGDSDRPYRRVILQPWIDREVLDFVDSDRGKELALTPPLTSDHLIRTKAAPLWVDAPHYDEPATLRQQLTQAIAGYAADYAAYFERHASRLPEKLAPFDPAPRVVLMPGLGLIGAGKDVDAARTACDIALHTLRVKSRVDAFKGVYEGLPEAELFEMEYRSLQRAKLGRNSGQRLAGEVALVTGAAGAIGSAIADALLEQGCHVAVTDLAGEPLDSLVRDLKSSHRNRVAGVPLDVTNAASVERGYDAVCAMWGGVDLVVLNAGAAVVSPLEEIKLEAFQRLERINVEGSLLMLSESARRFRQQGTGGDVVMISTKNVFAPGARFGAYSATKAAAHQLARIASLEMAEIGVRVNLVAPDAVFSHGARKSGLWAEVGPDRMKARGLSEEQLEEYYRNRNLLKATITARHVARAVVFFAARETPTTGATLPVDGGLPDATPR
ncbi:MAG: bifunctional aldolase/short-chain dehydrogenase [Terriglobia bacterium]